MRMVLLPAGYAVQYAAGAAVSEMFRRTLGPWDPCGHLALLLLAKCAIMSRNQKERDIESAGYTNE